MHIANKRLFAQLYWPIVENNRNNSVLEKVEIYSQTFSIPFWHSFTFSEFGYEPYWAAFFPHSPSASSLWL